MTRRDPFAHRVDNDAAKSASEVRFSQNENGITPANDQLILIARDEIEIDPNNPRRSDDPSMSDEMINSLMTSIENAGQEVPVIVGPRNPSSGKYQLIAGHRRFAAISRSEKIGVVKAILRENIESGEKGILQIQLIENAHRPDINLVSDSEAVHRLLKLYDNNREKVISILGIDNSTLTKKKAISEASDVLKEFFRKNNANDLTACYEMVKLAREDRDKAIDLMQSLESEGNLKGMRAFALSKRKLKNEEAIDSSKPDKGASTRGRPSVATAVRIDWSKRDPILHIDTKGSTQRFALSSEVMSQLQVVLDENARKNDSVAHAQ